MGGDHQVLQVASEIELQPQTRATFHAANDHNRGAVDPGREVPAAFQRHLVVWIGHDHQPHGLAVLGRTCHSCCIKDALQHGLVDGVRCVCPGVAFSSESIECVHPSSVAENPDRLGAMAIQLIGAGLGRTGTHSLKLALERLLGGTCHHMFEVGQDEAQAPVWHAAYNGVMPDWQALLAPYTAIVDWPGAGLWRQVAAPFPDAPVLLSTRSSAEVWHKSATDTIFKGVELLPDGDRKRFLVDMLRTFCPEWPDKEAVLAAYDAHNAAVRVEVPPDRLFEYQPGDGWAPLCAALGLPEPDEPFPHTNNTADMEARMAARFGDQAGS